MAPQDSTGASAAGERVIPPAWLIKPKRKAIWRIILHWSAGNYNPSRFDLAHYHCMINGDGEAVKGLWNAGQTAPPWHTRWLNSGSYGLSIAAMRGAVQGGPYGGQPMKQIQWERSAQAAAELVDAFNLRLSKRTCLSHMEVNWVYGLRQRRWDVSELPWVRHLPKEEVFAKWRRKVSWYLKTYHGRSE